VSGNEEFLDFAQHVLDVVWVDGPEAAAALEDERVELVAKLGENIVVLGAERYEAGEDEVVADYIHPPAQKIGVLVHAKATPELARMVAMHIAAAKPVYVTRDEVPETEIAEERGVYGKLPEVDSKPEDVRGKIVDGMLAKRFFAQTVLLDQAWVHDPSLTVARALAERGAEVKAFVRYNVGGE
jgi:elongation factor Ts